MMPSHDINKRARQEEINEKRRLNLSNARRAKITRRNIDRALAQNPPICGVTNTPNESALLASDEASFSSTPPPDQPCSSASLAPPPLRPNSSVSSFPLAPPPQYRFTSLPNVPPTPIQAKMEVRGENTVSNPFSLATRMRLDAKIHQLESKNMVLEAELFEVNEKFNALILENNNLKKVVSDKEKIIRSLRLQKSSRKVRKSIDRLRNSAQKKKRLSQMVTLLKGRESSPIDRDRILEIQRKERELLKKASPRKKARKYVFKTKRTEKKARIDPLMDMQLTHEISSGHHTLLKRGLIGIGKDILASKYSIEKLKNEFKQMFRLSEYLVKGTLFLVMENILAAISGRLEELKKNNLLRLIEFDNQILLGLGGDAGEGITKIVVTIGNSKSANSPHNQMPVGVFFGKDTRENLQSFFSVVENFWGTHELMVSFGVYQIKWFIFGDFVFLWNMIGHGGVGCTYNCPYCELNRACYGQKIRGIRRTLGISKIRAQTFLETGSLQRSKGISALPLIPIEFDHIVPAPLHIVLGLARKITDILEKESKNSGSLHRVKIAYAILKVKKDPATKAWNGNQIRKLCTGNGPSILSGCLKGPLAENIHSLLTLLGKFHFFATMDRLLSQQEVLELRNIANEFLEIFQKTSNAITPKLHVFHEHLPEFVQEHKFLGLLGESGLESLHAYFNRRMKLQKNKDRREKIRRATNDCIIRMCLFDRRNIMI